jgi:two-component system, OmpR family, response regulator
LAHEIASGLKQAGHSVKLETDGAVAAGVIERTRPDLVILDLMLPGLDGITLGNRAIKEMGIPVIFMSALDADADKIKGLAIGAEDYLAKPFLVAELILRVRAILRRLGIASAPLEVADIRLDEDRVEAQVRDKVLNLTSTEFKILVELMRGKSQVLSKTFLLTQVWGYDAFDPNLVEVHVSSLRKKLNSAGASAQIDTRRGFGYVLNVRNG